MELIDGELGWEGIEQEYYFKDKILSKHSNAKKFLDEIKTWISGAYVCTYKAMNKCIFKIR